MAKYSIKEKQILIFVLEDSIAIGEHSRQILTDRDEIDKILYEMKSIQEKLKKDVKDLIDELKKFTDVELFNELKKRGIYLPEMLSNHTEEEMFEGQNLPGEKDCYGCGSPFQPQETDELLCSSCLRDQYRRIKQGELINAKD